jgi:hypothetical protein
LVDGDFGTKGSVRFSPQADPIESGAKVISLVEGLMYPTEKVTLI